MTTEFLVGGRKRSNFENDLFLLEQVFFVVRKKVETKKCQLVEFLVVDRLRSIKAMLNEWQVLYQNAMNDSFVPVAAARVVMSRTIVPNDSKSPGTVFSIFFSHFPSSGSFA